MEGQLIIKMENEKYNEDGSAKIEVIKNVYAVPEGFIKEEIVIRRTLIKSKSLRSKEIQVKLS